MHDELTIARELPVIPEGNAGAALAPVIEQDYLAFATATSKPQHPHQPGPAATRKSRRDPVFQFSPEPGDWGHALSEAAPIAYA